MTTKDEALNATMADSALERMAENERELGLDYMEPALEPTTKQKVDAAVEQYAKTGNGRVLEVALRNIIINETLDKMAKNARELGLDYEPAQKDYKAFYDGEKRCSVEVEQPAQPAQPSKPWVGLTEYERADVYKAIPAKEFCVDAVGIAIEAKLKEKNGF